MQFALEATTVTCIMSVESRISDADHKGSYVAVTGERRGRSIGRLDLELLTAFVTIVDCGGLDLAADELHLTQSGISMQMKRLEDRVGRRLLQRDARRIALSEEGRILYRYASHIVALAEEARAHLSAANGVPSGPVRLGLPEWLTDDALQRLLRRFARAYPLVQVVTHVDASAGLRRGVSEGRLDLALGIVDEVRNAPPPLYCEPLVWVVGDERTLDVGREVPLALFGSPCPYRRIAMDGVAHCGWRGREVFTSTSVATVRTAVETGFGISVFPQSAVRPGLRTLTSSEGLPDLPETRLGIYKAPRILGTPAAHLCDHLEETLSRRRTPPAPR